MCRFPPYDSSFAFWPPVVIADAACGMNYAMTRNEQGHRVAGNRPSHGTRGPRVAYRVGKLQVGREMPDRHLGKRLPHLHLERRGLEVQPHLVDTSPVELKNACCTRVVHIGVPLECGKRKCGLQASDCRLAATVDKGCIAHTFACRCDDELSKRRLREHIVQLQSCRPTSAFIRRHAIDVHNGGVQPAGARRTGRASCHRPGKVFLLDYPLGIAHAQKLQKSIESDSCPCCKHVLEMKLTEAKVGSHLGQ